MDALALPANATCPIAHALDVLGSKWTFLILREAMRGTTRFADFRIIGIPGDVLASRLAALVDDGVMTRRAYRVAGARAREEYVLTERGRDAALVLGALSVWGLAHCDGTDTQWRFVDRETGEPLRPTFVAGDRIVETPRAELVRQ